MYGHAAPPAPSATPYAWSMRQFDSVRASPGNGYLSPESEGTVGPVNP
jgi:hypothetical protein